MGRLTRAEQQQVTHDRLLEAGRSVLRRRGFLAATVDEIAEEAGYTRGAVYKHFGGKEGLWQSVVEAHTEAHLQLLGAALDRVSSREELIAALIPSAFTDDRDAARWSTAAMEFMAAVTGNAEAAAVSAAAQRRHEEQIVALLEDACRRLHVKPAMPLGQVVVVLGALGGSLGLRAALDPATDAAALTAGVLAVMFPDANP
ncbi:TetR/AcrR family transcriptional regulator [Streptomyces sp. enrichment culture]|uniref:TetR/AcrR family transcriptional regulator n=1 Tax=Streptomyces sp. enrichment culture TaxID=1795815 RepID=UPI003F54CBDC